MKHRLAFVLFVCAGTFPLSAQSSAAGGVLRLDPALDNFVSPGTQVEKLNGNLKFAEGPVWLRKSGYLLFSDIPANAIMKWTSPNQISVFRKPVFAREFPDGIQIGTNGLTLDRQGRLIACEHGNWRVSRTEKDGTVATLADRYEGKRLNSPNDVVGRSNGDIYFTDPNSVARRHPPDPHDDFATELGFNGVYRLRVAGKLELLTKAIPYPNGLAFSPNEEKLYIANSLPNKFLMVYDVQTDGRLANGKIFLDLSKEPGDGVPDGMKVDRAVNLYATGPGGILIISPQGKHLGTIRMPEVPANCAWGDADGKTLYKTARTGLYRILVKIGGVQP